MTASNLPSRSGTLHRILRTAIAPAAVALTVFSWGATDAFAAPSDGRTKINAMLADFANDMNPPGKVTTTITAKLPELLLALSAVIETELGANPATFGPTQLADLVAGVLIEGAGAENAKVRSDRDKIVAAVIDQAVRSAGVENAPSWIDDVLGAAIVADPAGDKLKPITLAGQAAAIGQALKSGSTSDIGIYVAQLGSVKTAISQQTTAANKNKLVATAILNAAGGTNPNTVGVEEFVNALLSQGDLPLTGTGETARSTTAIALAKLVKKSLAAAGATVAAGGANLVKETYATPQQKTESLQALQALANTAISDSGLKTAAAEIMASIGALYVEADGNTNGLTTLATSLASNRDGATKALVANGAIRLAADSTQASAIFNGVAGLTTGGSVSDLYKFTATALNGVDSAFVQGVLSSALTRLGPITDTNKTKLGTTVIGAISLTNPTGALEVGKFLSTQVPTDIATQSKLAADLSKAGKSAAAAAQAAAGVAFSKTLTTDKAAIGIAANKAASKYISAITESIGLQVTDNDATFDQKRLFVQKLAEVNTGKAAEIAVGISLAAPVGTARFVNEIVFNTASGKIKGSAAKVAQAVATSVDVERSAEVATLLASTFALTSTTTDQKLKSSTAAAIATGIAKGINTRPDVRTDNRADELGEVAASMVGQILIAYQTPGALQGMKEADLLKLVSGVTSSIIKSLSKTEQIDIRRENTHLPSGLSIGTRQADMSEAAAILGDVLFTLQQATLLPGAEALSGTLLTAIRTKLQADIPKLAGKAYAQDFVDLFAENMSTATKYENGVRLVSEIQNEANSGQTGLDGLINRSGAVVDPETDSRG